MIVDNRMFSSILRLVSRRGSGKCHIDSRRVMPGTRAPKALPQDVSIYVPRVRAGNKAIAASDLENPEPNILGRRRCQSHSPRTIQSFRLLLSTEAPTCPCLHANRWGHWWRRLRWHRQDSGQLLEHLGGYLEHTLERHRYQ